MNNQISNLKVEVPTGMNLNDKDYLNCLLSSLKDIEKNYAIALTEASNEFLYETYKNIFDQIAQMQRDAFELAFSKGWYILEQAQIQKISNKFDTLSKEYEDFKR